MTTVPLIQTIILPVSIGLALIIAGMVRLQYKDYSKIYLILSFLLMVVGEGFILYGAYLYFRSLY